MKFFLLCMKKSFGVILSDKPTVILSALPVFVGSLLYYFLGSWIYTDLLPFGKNWIDSFLSGSSWGVFFYYAITGIMMISLFFLISWTFVIVVSLIAAPFNDLISSRVEKLLLNEVPVGLGDSIMGMISKITSIILTELKKIVFIIVLTLIAYLLSLIPFLAPIAILISSLLLAASFLDYSWSRHNLSFLNCIKTFKSKFLVTSISGGLFLFLLAVPIVNLLAYPFSVIFFTVMFVEKDLVK